MGWAPRRPGPASRTARTGGAPRAPIGSRRASVGRWPFSGPGPCTPRSRARGRVGSSGCRGGCVRAPCADGGSGRRRQPTMRGARLCSPASRAGSWPRSGSCPTTTRRSTPSSRKRAHLCFRSRPLQDCATAIDASDGRLLEQPARSRDAAEAESLVVRTTMVQTRRSWRSARERSCIEPMRWLILTWSDAHYWGGPGCVVEK